MTDFRTIYKILKILQRSMDLEEFDKSSLSAERLGLSEPKWSRLMAMLINEGYISGGQTWNAMDCGYPRVILTRPEITLKGLEYLEENSLMRKAADMAKGILDVTLIRGRKRSLVKQKERTGHGNRYQSCQI